MPIIKSGYTSPLLLKNGHVQTMYPSLFRKPAKPNYRRERITIPDGDFLDLDWSVTGAKKLAIISHGLEGSAYRAYVTGMVNALNSNGRDVLAWNFRSCSGVPNRTLRFYHNGATDDLGAVINYAVMKQRYEEIVLIGFSMGGNLTLLYLGQQGKDILPIIKKAVVFSVPCDLTSSSKKLASVSNKLYMRRFLIMLHKKIRQKMELFPEKINDDEYEKIKTFEDFDNRYTAPLHGFKNAQDYWTKCSCKPLLNKIKIPTLIVNAKNDPFLSTECFPIDEAKNSDKLYLEMPASGGHVGFVTLKSEMYWSEKRTIEFLNS